MAGPIHGMIENMFLGASQTTGTIQTTFVNIYNFLNNNTGTLGIQRIAYSTGSNLAGTPLNGRGMNYYDRPNPAGDNAWSCFCFSSASNPYYFLVQWAGASGMGTLPGGPGLFRGAATVATLGISVCWRLDGGNPWNGSSGSLGVGADVKGTPVWHPGTSSLIVSPRSNDGIRGGAHAGSRQNLGGFLLVSSDDVRMHQVADYDNYVILVDDANNNSYGAHIIAKYTPISGVNPQIPYVVFSDDVVSLTNATLYGSVAGTGIFQGCIGYPNNVALSGTCCVAMERYSTTFFQNAQAQPNRVYNTPTFDEFPLIVGIFETPNQVGLCGQVYDFYREVYNVPTHDTSADGQRAAFGTTTIASVKLTVPWLSGTVPGSGVSRGGKIF